MRFEIRHNNIAGLLIPIFCIVAVLIGNCPGQPPMRRPGGRMPPDFPMRGQDRFSRGQDTGVRDAASDVRNKLQAVLEQVNAGGSLGKQEIDLLNGSLREARKSLNDFSPEEKADWYVLSAWTEYYAGELRRAMLNAAKATKEDPQNADAELTHLAMALVNQDFRDVISIVGEKPQSTIFGEDRYRGGYGGGYSSRGMLDFDAASLQIKLLGRKLPAMQLKCVNGASFNYTPGSALCMLLWRLESDESDIGGYSATGRFERDRRSGPRSYRGGRGYGDRTSTEQIEAFGELFLQRFDDSGVRFVAVNLDPVSKRPQLISTLFDNSWPWAQVMATDPANSELQQLTKLSLSESVLAVTAADGTVSYMGPAAGFMAPLLASHFAAEAKTFSPGTSLGQSTAAGQSGQGVRNFFEGVSEGQQGADANSPGAFGPGPIAGQSQPNEPTERTAPTPTARDRDTEKVYPQAEDWLQMAKFHQKSGGLPMLTRKMMVENCRKILEHYPESPQAEEARKMLRELSEEDRRRYNITDEELGL